MDTAAWLKLPMTLDQRAFVKSVGETLHLVVAPAGEDLPNAFRTVAVSEAALPPRSAISQILPVAKTLGNPYADRISIGRARNCDLVLRDPSVSKLHAHLERRGSNGFALVDLGSQNGTRINGRRLVPNLAVPIEASDTLQLGRVQARILGAYELYDLLRDATM